jgi:hypothetical protein
MYISKLKSGNPIRHQVIYVAPKRIYDLFTFSHDYQTSISMVYILA